MTYTAFGDDTYPHDSPDLWAPTPSYAPTPGYLDRECTPSVICPSPRAEDIVGERSLALHQPRQDRQDFRSEAGQEHERFWNGQSLNRIHYRIEWKVTLNNRVVAKDTDQDLTQPPSSYWQQIRETAGSVLRRKIARNRRVRPDDTTIVVSVNDRSQRDLTKRFENTGIDWTAVEEQLQAWAHLYSLGKKLRLQISINYIDDSESFSSRYDKRGKLSVTKKTLAERDVQIDAEESSGQYSVWRDVYRTMRCTGPPCRHEGQYCWQDPVGKRHYRLKTHHLKALVKYVEGGGVLETHDDIPDSLREQLHAEDNQKLEKRKKSPDNSTIGSMCPPININVLPSGPSQQSMPSPAGGATPVQSGRAKPVIVHGLLDLAVDDYTKWQQSRVRDETFRDNINRARDVTFENCLDLMQIYEDQNPGFFVTRGVKVGAARRFVHDIGYWVKQREGNTQHASESDMA